MEDDDTEVLTDTCEECNTRLVRHKEHVFCPECGHELTWTPKIPKEIKCPICGGSMNPFGAIDADVVHGGGNMKGSFPIDKPLTVGRIIPVQMFLCDHCLNIQQFLDETKFEPPK